MMFRKIIGFTLPVLCVLGLCGCASSHAIKITGGKDLITEYPSRAKTGETVQIITVFVSDGELVVSGGGGEFVEENVYEFVMPDHDVSISASVNAYPDGS